jgi:hypothetical protein
MKLSIFSLRAQEKEGRQWFKGGVNITANKIELAYNDAESQLYYQLSFQYDFEFADDEVYFAYNPPYTYTDLQNYLLEAERLTEGRQILARRVLCKTIAGNRVELLTVTNVSRSPEEYEKK